MSTAIPRPDLVAGAGPVDAADDRLRRVVQALLALYLLPALLVVLIVGVMLMALQGLCSLTLWAARRLGVARTSPASGASLPSAGPPGSPSLTGRAPGLVRQSLTRGGHDGFARRN